MVYFECSQHGGTTFLVEVCPDIDAAFRVCRPLPVYREISIAFDPPVEGESRWFAVLFCEQCLDRIGIPLDVDEITETDIDARFGSFRECFFQPKLICQQCFADYAPGAV